jgi:MraZ protein
MYLTGTYYHALEQKGRVSIPKNFRSHFGSILTITLGLDGCLFLLHQDEFNRMLSEQSRLPLTHQQSRDWVRIITNNAVELTIDSLGRILIPEFLRNKVGLKKQVIIVGSLNRLEVWDQSTYHAYIDRIEEKKEEIAALVGQINNDRQNNSTSTSHASRSNS